MLKCDLCIKVAAKIEITTVFLTGDTGKEMKKDTDNFLFHNIINDIWYTRIGHKSSKRKHFVTEILAEKVAKIEKRNVDESDDLQNEGMKTFIQSKILVAWNRLEVLLGLKLSGHTDTLTEASNV